MKENKDINIKKKTKKISAKFLALCPEKEAQAKKWFSYKKNLFKATT